MYLVFLQCNRTERKENAKKYSGLYFHQTRPWQTSFVQYKSFANVDKRGSQTSNSLATFSAAFMFSFPYMRNNKPSQNATMWNVHSICSDQINTEHCQIYLTVYLGINA